MTKTTARPVKLEDDDDTKTECQKAVVAARDEFDKAVHAISELERDEKLIKKRLSCAKARKRSALKALKEAEDEERQDTLRRAKRVLHDAVQDRDAKRHKVAEAAAATCSALTKRTESAKALSVATNAAEAAMENQARQTSAFKDASMAVDQAKCVVAKLESGSGDAKDGTGDQKMQ